MDRGRLLGYFEASLGFIFLLFLVMGYMLLVVFVAENIFLDGDLPYKAEILSLGTVFGASAIVLGESIRTISRATHNISRAIRDLPAKQVEAEEEKYELPSSRDKGCKKDGGEGTDKEDEPICYDFMYS